MELFSPWMVVICWHSLLCVNQPNFWFHSFSKFVSPWAARSCTSDMSRTRQHARPWPPYSGHHLIHHTQGPPPLTSTGKPAPIDVLGARESELIPAPLILSTLTSHASRPRRAPRPVCWLAQTTERITAIHAQAPRLRLRISGDRTARGTSHPRAGAMHLFAHFWRVRDTLPRHGVPRLTKENISRCFYFEFPTNTTT